MIKIFIYMIFSLTLFAKEENVIVKDCIDGDTCTVLLKENIEVRVRLACIDAPELSQGIYAKVSQNFLNQKIKNKQVMLNQIDLDIYTRPIVFLYLNNENINFLMLKEGLAEVYRGKTPFPKDICYKYEHEAKAQEKGIWSLPNYVSPGKVRRKSRL